MNKNYQRKYPSVDSTSASQKLHAMRRRYSNLMLLVIILILLVIIGGVALSMAFSAHTYVLTDGDRYETVRLYPGSVEEAKKAAGFRNLKIIGQREGDNTTYLTLGQALSAQITTKDQTLTVPFTACTVEELLNNNGIAFGSDDIITPALDEWLIEDTEVSVVSVTYRTETQTSPIPFEVETHESADIYEGEQRVARYGKNGESEITYRITLHDGAEVGKEAVSEKQIAAPVNCIVEQGTRKKEEPSEKQPDEPDSTVPASKPAPPENVTNSTPDGALSTAGRAEVWSVPAGIYDDTKNKTITANDGSSFKYTSVIDVKATAYHRIEDGGLITASGTTTRYGTVAVDPRIIPLGSRVYVVSDGGDKSWSYGPGLAEDTGGLIKGNRVDLFFMTGEEAVEFGIRPAKIYILE